jgi:hypothetical protein
MYYWKRTRTRRRQLIRLGIHRKEVYKATRKCHFIALVECDKKIP